MVIKLNKVLYSIIIVYVRSILYCTIWTYFHFFLYNYFSDCINRRQKMSSQHLSRRDVEDLRSSIDKIIYKCLGYSDSSLISTASSCLTNGY